jgi:hypothetical protein
MAVDRRTSTASSRRGFFMRAKTCNGSYFRVPLVAFRVCLARKAGFFDTERRLQVMHMFLNTAALLAIALFIASLALAVAGMTQRQKVPFQASSTYQGSDLNSLSAEDINRKILETAEAMRATQAERFLQRQH